MKYIALTILALAMSACSVNVIVAPHATLAVDSNKDAQEVYLVQGE